MSTSAPALSPAPMRIRQLLFSFKGRISRRLFWIGVLTTNLAYAALHVTAFFAFGRVTNAADPFLSFTGALFTAFLVLVSVGLWIEAALAAKRWHDRGKSAWMVLVFLIPLIGQLWSLVELGFLPGTPGANQYGAPPTPTRI